MRVIDLFSGAGGFSTGAEMAGCNVVWAGNHWPEAVEWHARNHPNAIHVTQDLHQADWSLVPKHDVMLASTCPALNATYFIVCQTCGNKRCPKATDHRLECSGSNEPGQPGSRY